MKTGHSSLLLLPCISMRQLVFGLVLGWGWSACGQTAPAADRVAKQNALFEEFYQAELKNSPERATAYGDYRFNSQLGQYSLAEENYEMPVNQQNGVHTRLADLPNAVPFDSVPHYEDYISRLRQIPHVLDQ